MEKDPVISVIVPIYNVEAYLDACISSLCNQTYHNMEIILVDDGSSDRSGKLCDEYAKRDSRIKVFHIANSGQSHARNIGMEHATGEYIGFVDGDDYADFGMYEYLLRTIQEHDAQIAECNFTGRKVKVPDVIEEGHIISMSGREALIRQLDITVKSRFPSTSLWSKLFVRDLLKDIRLPDGKVHEEFAFLCQAFYYCSRYVYINELFYHRTLRGDSTTAEKFSARTFDKLAVYRERNLFLEQQDDQQLLQLSKVQEYELMLHYYAMSAEQGMKEHRKQLEREMKVEKKSILSSALPYKRKLQYRLFFIHPAAMQAMKFLVVGVYNFILSYLVYSLLIWMGMNYLLSNGISFCFSVLNSFFISQKMVFKGQGSLLKMLFKVTVSYIGTGLVLQSILLAFWIERMGVPELLAPVLNVFLITPVNFVIQKFWAYK